MSSGYWVTGVFVAGGLAWAAVSSPESPSMAMAAEAPAVASSPVASCSASSCHGGGVVGTVGSEQTTWATGDPHATAYRVLFNDDSTRITANLRKTNPKRPAAHQDKSCVACHTAGTAACFDGSAVTNASDGVGCDACHGPSGLWRTRHYEPFWKGLSADEKGKLGFRETKDLVTRTQACVGCHVGDATREVTHDLIAAGHPRLAFESTRYHVSPRYKKHWVESLPARDFEVRAWAVGQVVAAAAVVDLLRARSHDATASWPELAEQGCFQCHQGLKGSPRTGTASAGTADWQPWYLSLLDVAAAETPRLFPGAATPDLTPVTALAAEMRKPKPDLATARSHADRAHHVLGLWIHDLKTAERTHPGPRITADDVKRLTAAVANHALTRSEWDAVAPHYLSAAALAHADPAAVPDANRVVNEMKPYVRYAKGFNSPADYDAAKVRALFRKLAGGNGR